MISKSMIFAGSLAGIMMLAAPANAVVITVPLGVIIVPPTQTFTPGVTFTDAGDNGADYEFFVSQPMTLTVSSFTNSSIGGTGVFTFSSIGLYAGLGMVGMPLQTGTISSSGNTNTAALTQYSLNEGFYTIAYRGTVTGEPAGVGSNVTFAAGTVPEPATWAMMIGGFGLVGAGLRSRRKQTMRITYA